MKKLFPSFILFIFISSAALAQGTSPAMQNIVSKLKTFATNYVIEKAYLHFDKPYYSAGDEMYFKAYVTLGDSHAPSKASGILHVDLINPGNVIIRNIILQLDNGVAAGSFSLPDTLQGGAYRVRAYTRYMENTPGYFFDKSIPIVSVTGNTGVSANTHQAAKPDIQFFAEGGDLIANILTKVAFKAVGTNGMGINAKGVIVDNTNAQVATFSSSHLGMGSFYIQPEDGKTYKAKVTFGNGAQSTINLPSCVSKGITLQTKDTLGKVSINIVCNKAYLTDNMNKDVNLVIYAGGKLRTVNTKLDSRVMGMDIADDQFPAGVMRITLFSQDGEPLSERLVFLQNASLLNITMNTDKPSYKTRDHVAINFNAKSNGAGVPGFFSAAVIDESKVPYDDNNETTILSYLLLTSDIKGNIEQPNYYFASKAPQTADDLDNLMLTQGYRRFTWKQVLSGDSKPFTIAPEKSLYIAGSEKTAKGEPVAGKDIILAEGANIIATLKTDNSGNFLIDNMQPFNAGTQFSLQATGSTKDKNSTVITVAKQPEPPVADTVNGNMSQAPAGYSAGNSNAASHVSANADQVIDGDDIGNAASISAALAGRMNDVNFISGIPYLKGSKYPMLIVVDGKIRSSDAKLDNITPSNVKNIELLKGANAATYGSSGSSGVLVINTRNGASGGEIAQQTENVPRISESSVPNRVNYRSSSLAGPGHADQVVLGDAIKNAPTLSSGLNGILRGVDFVNGVPYIRGGSAVSGGGMEAQPMFVVVDGVEGNGGVDNINPGSVEAVEVLKGANASIYGTNGGPGVIVITTRMQSDVVDAPQSALGNLIFKPLGFYKTREFYSPKYDASATPNAGPDRRSTIYWNPSLVTGNDGNASFDFYNSDGRGSYRVIIEGIDSNGNPGRQIFRYKVE